VMVLETEVCEYQQRLLPLFGTFHHLFATLACLSLSRPATIPFEIQLCPRGFLMERLRCAGPLYT
jgi:hypothetical protein